MRIEYKTNFFYKERVKNMNIGDLTFGKDSLKAFLSPCCPSLVAYCDQKRLGGIGYIGCRASPRYQGFNGNWARTSVLETIERFKDIGKKSCKTTGNLEFYLINNQINQRDLNELRKVFEELKVKYRIIPTKEKHGPFYLIPENKELIFRSPRPNGD